MKKQLIKTWVLEEIKHRISQKKMLAFITLINLCEICETFQLRKFLIQKLRMKLTWEKNGRVKAHFKVLVTFVVFVFVLTRKLHSWCRHSLPLPLSSLFGKNILKIFRLLPSSVYIYMYMYIYMYIYVSVYICICVCVCVCVYIYICPYMSIYIQSSTNLILACTDFGARKLCVHKTVNTMFNFKCANWRRFPYIFCYQLTLKNIKRGFTQQKGFSRFN